MSETTINQRLNFLLGELGMKPGAFSRALNLSETTVRNYVDRSAKPSSDVLEKIATTFKQVNVVWLVTGDGEPLLPEYSGPNHSHSVNAKNFLGNVGVTTNGSIAQDIGTHATLLGAHANLHDCEKELDSSKREIELLRQQLTMAQALIAAKEETITLLRGSYNRPN